MDMNDKIVTIFLLKIGLITLYSLKPAISTLTIKEEFDRK